MAVKPPFSNFGSDCARTLVFGANDFYCCRNECKKAIYFSITVSPAEMAVKPPFSNYGSDHARVSVFGAIVA